MNSTRMLWNLGHAIAAVGLVFCLHSLVQKERTVVAPIVMGHPTEWPQPHGRRAPQIYWTGA